MSYIIQNDSQPRNVLSPQNLTQKIVQPSEAAVFCLPKHHNKGHVYVYYMPGTVPCLSEGVGNRGDRGPRPWQMGAKINDSKNEFQRKGPAQVDGSLSPPPKGCSVIPSQGTCPGTGSIP